MYQTGAGVTKSSTESRGAGICGGEGEATGTAEDRNREGNNPRAKERVAYCGGTTRQSQCTGNKNCVMCQFNNTPSSQNLRLKILYFTFHNISS